jgi:nicotinamide-nucleotide amidase
VRARTTAEILAVGSELLTPFRIDSDSLFLTRRLNDLGIVVRAKAIVGDDRAMLAAFLRASLTRADLVVTTGGLGPTEDDLTREVVAEVLARPLREDAEVLAGIRARFDRRGVSMPAINRRQAMVPDGATVLPNINGTAPGLWIDAGDRAVVLLPGPPRELEPMFDAHVAPRLGRTDQPRHLRRRVLKITGRSESQVEEVAQPVYSSYAQGVVPVETTILASPGQIELHLQAVGADETALVRRLDEATSVLAAALAPYVFSIDGRSLEAVVGDRLQQRGWRIGVAESCTGGLVLGRLTDVPGSSAWVAGGVVAYANDVKSAMLGVPPALIDTHGAVSEPVALAMADGARVSVGAEVGVGVTGIAGPGGGSPEKPVGTVVIAVSAGEREVRRFAFTGDRDTIRRHSTAAALDLVRRALDPPGSGRP